ncbi:MAG: hypothetical protein IPN69_10770 [Acidobacteria bacterium]|nr:hypothetical protein [Acidobacteriota bacterium]
MICHKCGSFNEDNNAFCINCGATFYAPSESSPTIMSPGTFGGQTGGLSNPSLPTVFHAPVPPPVQPNTPPSFQASFGAFQQSFPMIPPAQAEEKSRIGLFIGIGAVFLLLLVGGIAAIVFFVDFKPKTTEKLPASLGLYFQNADKSEVTEIKKLDFKDGVAARDEIKEDGSLTVLEPRPNIVLYSDGKDIPVSELRLVEVDSIKDDGTLRQVKFKAATVEGKPEMKRIWVDEDLAAIRYAFVLFDGYFEDGKHRFWPFEVKAGNKKDNGDLVKSETVDRKSKSASPSPTASAEKTVEAEKTIEPPPNSKAVYCQAGNVVLRSGPTQASGKLGSLRMGQKLYVLDYSDDWETFITRDGRELNSNYAYVQTESGKRGWVYAAFIR